MYIWYIDVIDLTGFVVSPSHRHQHRPRVADAITRNHRRDVADRLRIANAHGLLLLLAVNLFPRRLFLGHMMCGPL